ncbi:exosortase family protein XrtF [Chryseosolibacter indicus]|uniref:Exosortase family protein XrtF n=1 Tax=Chryseosolibacter indicus TaxID=2782351 RepID=A0ABS5VX80_9BACT|nr:exosortase family protein XrtF [Chryseosolibacter indicus]MBT1705349.1 exosortase family protein XrtF [Chryseosolibacter indicus]
MLALIKEFKPALVFLGKFLVFYLVGNILYGLFIESYGKRADPITKNVANQSAVILNFVATTVNTEVNPAGPTVMIKANNVVVLSVFEGCNGVNVIIVFVAFLFAFNSKAKKLVWFLLLGIAVIHIFNLLRISLLYYTAIYKANYFYYFHKYFFTAILYLVVFMLWGIWITILNNAPKTQTSKA